MIYTCKYIYICIYINNIYVYIWIIFKYISICLCLHLSISIYIYLNARTHAPTWVREGANFFRMGRVRVPCDLDTRRSKTLILLPRLKRNSCRFLLPKENLIYLLFLYLVNSHFLCSLNPLLLIIISLCTQLQITKTRQIVV